MIVMEGALSLPACPAQSGGNQIGQAINKTLHFFYTEPDFRFRDNLIFHECFHLQKAGFTHHLNSGHLDAQLVTGYNRLQKTRLDFGKVIYKVRTVQILAVIELHASRLGHSFDDQDARHNLFFREMADKIRFIDSNILDSH